MPAKKAKTVKKIPQKKSKKNITSTQTKPQFDPANLNAKEKKYYDILMNLRNHIIGQVKTLSEEALSTSVDTGEHSSALSNHLADYGSDNFLHNMELDIMTGEMEDIEMIDEAIERLFTGEYGKCLDCGCKISEERLKAKPHARYCIKCKSEREKNPDLNER